MDDDEDLLKPVFEQENCNTGIARRTINPAQETGSPLFEVKTQSATPGNRIEPFCDAEMTDIIIEFPDDVRLGEKP